MQSILHFNVMVRVMRGACSCLLFILSGMAYAEPVTEPADTLTLRQALTLAMQANPDIAVALREQAVVRGIQTQAGLRPNPSLTTWLQDTRHTYRQTTLQLNQELELGNKRGMRMQAADAAYDKATVVIAVQKNEIHANVVAVFYEVLAAQERLQLAGSSLEIARLALDASAKRVRAGKSSPVEETKSGIAYSTANIEVTQAQGQLNSSRKRLSALWGSAWPVFTTAIGEVADLPASLTLDHLTAQLPNAPAMLAARQEVQVRAASIKVEQSKAVPNVTVSAGVLNNQELGGINQAVLGLTVPIPVFDRNQGAIQEAVSRKDQAEERLLALHNQLSASLASHYERLHAARQVALTLRQQILPGAQSAFEAASKGFSAGKFNFLDVLDAQRTLFQAKTQYVQALLDAHQASADIERVLGDVLMHSPQQE